MGDRVRILAKLVFNGMSKNGIRVGREEAFMEVREAVLFLSKVHIVSTFLSRHAAPNSAKAFSFRFLFLLCLYRFT